MNIGAVIIAAGLSSRMGAFKPMLNIGSISVAQHVINTFHQAGVTKIAVVTGHNAKQLEQHLADSGVVFLRNENYRTTEMFDSAKIGLSHWKDTCDRILFTPVDIPLFTSNTVEKLIQTPAEVACPVCGGKRGHPLILSASAIHTILKDSGEGGMKGAISRLAVPMVPVEVDDFGTLRDADTPEEFEILVNYHHSRTGCAPAASEKGLCPTEREIERMLNEMSTPKEVRSHCDTVSVKAENLAAQANVPVDLTLLKAACKLHDMAKTEGKNHPALAAEFLKEKGYPALAEIVVQHHDLSAEACVEAELLYLADKLVRGTQDVTLNERFSASKKKCLTPEAIEVWARRYRDALQIVERYQLNVDIPHSGI